MKEEEKERKLPEFIIIEEEDQEYYEDPTFSKFKPKTPEKTTWKVRVFCFLASIVAFFWTLGAIILTLCIGFIHLITFCKLPLFQTLTKLYWSWTKGGAVVTLGLIVAVFNVTLGLMIIVFYFSQTKDEWQKKMAARMVYPHMKDYI